MADTTFVNAVTLTDAGWFNDANTVTYKGATTTMLVGGGVGSVAVWTTATGSGSPVRATSPTLVTPTIGAATATSVNKITLTAPATGATLTLTDGKTLAATNTLTLSGTDGTTMTFPTTSATLARTDAANTFTGVQTLSSQPILSSLTASLPVFSDGSKGLVSNAMTGTGNVMMSASPTTTGTLTAAIANFSGLLTANAGATVASGQTLTLTGATVAGAPTWSSSQAITLSTAAQPNVTSLGTLTGLVIVGNAGITGKLTEGFTSATTWAANTSATNLIISNSSATANSTALYEAGVTNTDSTYGAVKFGAVATGSYAADFVIAPRQVTTGTYIERLRVANNGVITITGDETVTGSLTAGAISGTTGAFTLNQNAATYVSVTNTTAGTASQAAFKANAGGFPTLYAGVLNGSYTTSGVYRANGVFILGGGVGTAGLTLVTDTNTPIYFAVNNTEVGQFSSTGLSVTGTLGATGQITGLASDGTTKTIAPTGGTQASLRLGAGVAGHTYLDSDSALYLRSGGAEGSYNTALSISKTGAVTIPGTLGVTGNVTLGAAVASIAAGTTAGTASFGNSSLAAYMLVGGPTNVAIPNHISLVAAGGVDVQGALSLNSNYLEGFEQTAPAAGIANSYRIFAQDNGAGKTQLMVIFASGAAQQIAIQP